MVKWLHTILFITISFSFFISATEIDLGESQNTFFDEYDTYVQPVKETPESVSTTDQKQNTSILLNNSFCTYTTSVFKPQGVNCCLNLCSLHLPKLFLRNSVWRI